MKLHAQSAKSARDQGIDAALAHLDRVAKIYRLHVTRQRVVQFVRPTRPPR